MAAKDIKKTIKASIKKGYALLEKGEEEKAAAIFAPLEEELTKLKGYEALDKLKGKRIVSEKFTQIADTLSDEQIGKTVSIRGWVYRKREQKELIFLIIRDSSDIIQAVVKKGSKAWSAAQKITIESSCELSGKIKKDARAPTGYELQIEDLRIVGLAERFPITKDLSEEFLRSVRHLWVRSRKLTLIFKIRSAVFEAIHEFYKQRGFYEIQSPSFTACACEGGSTLFEVKYFDKKAYLTQSWQLYAEALIFGLERIYCIAPSYRAEKSRTRRHLAEYWHHEMEAAWMSFDELLKFEEELILFIVKYVLRKCKKQLKELGRDTTELEKLKAPFARMKYAEAIKKLGKKWGYDLTDEDERKLVAEVGKPLFLTHFPRETKAFYMKVDPKDKKVVLAADLLVPGVGEITGGSSRIETAKELLESIKLFKLPHTDYTWYLDLRKFGSVPHAGFGLGIERLVMWLTGCEHIFDTIPFPRTMDRLTP
ncbi:MAG: asparagine--tRNA ligase [Candidatus Nanoarchaeia archaeon]